MSHFLEQFSESSQEQPLTEVSFQEGVEQAMIRIKELLARTTDRDIFIVINGSSADVGKTTFLGAIGRELYEIGVRVKYLSTEELNDYKWQQEHSDDPNEKAVYIITQQGILAPSTEQYKEKSKVNGRRIVGDLYIGIYRDDRPFETVLNFKPVADILIPGLVCL